MKYYKVIKGNKTDYFTGYTTIKGELLTAKERNSKFRYLKDDVFELVEVKKTDTYKLFGARFQVAE